MADPGSEQNLPSAGDISAAIDETAVPEDERADILSEIDRLVAESEPSGQIPDEFLRPRRSGVVFPVVINLVAAAAVVGGLYFITQYFRIREDSIALESRSYFSAEAQLIEEILRESEERLARKDQEITQIQSQLAALDREKQNLEANLDSQVAEREAELREQLAEELEAERSRLTAAGESEESIAARLAEIEAQREEEFADLLESFRAEAQEELDRLAAELDAREAQLEQTLAASQEERARIAREAADREQQLREELGAEIEALEAAEQDARDRLLQLQALREEEALLTDRILGSFAVVVEDIEAGLSEEALSGLESLELLLADQRPVDSEGQRRRQTELALASTLRGLVREIDVLRENIAIRDLTSTDEEEATLERERAAELISAAGDVVRLAEEAREDGLFNEARSLYRQALNTIPSLGLVYPGILDLESSRRELVMTTTVSEAMDLLAAGSTEAAIATYLQALRDIAEGEEDPLLDVVSGIQTATSTSQRELLLAQQSVSDGLQVELAQQADTITSLNRQLLTARNQVSTRDATISELQTRVTTLNEQLASRQRSLSDRTAELERAEQRVTALEDDLSSLRVELQSAGTRASGLETSLAAARRRVAELETSERELTAELASLAGEISQLESQRDTAVARAESLENRVSSLQAELQQRPLATEAAVDDPSDEPSAATQAELDSLNATVAELNGTIDQLNLTITRSSESVARLEAEVSAVQTALREAENERDTAQTELEAARETVAGLREQIADLRSQRDTVTGETSGLETEVASLTEELSVLESYRNRIEGLTSDYERAQSAAVRLAGAGEYDTARERLLVPLRTDVANEVLPGIATNVDQIYSGLITQAENLLASDVRTATLKAVTGLTDQVKRNIDDAQGSVAVQSYLTREPDVRDIANDLFEIIELASRDLSAPEIDYRLLGSISRVTGNLVVVERLVALESSVGDVVEIRRNRELGQQVPVGLGTILEVSERRVLVSVDEIYLIDVEPALADVVYVAQE
jgi:chromosome segregation ATPase